MFTFDKKISIDGVAVILAAVVFTFWFGSFATRAELTAKTLEKQESEIESLTKNQADTSRYLAIVAQALKDKNITIEQ